jgi:predicted N-acetyltransferase YhbS
MINPFDLETARQRQQDLLREARERRIAAPLRKVRRDVEEKGRGVPKQLEDVAVRWGLAEDEVAVADLLELNGMPRWVAFEERFIVAQKNGKVLGAVRYRMESKRLLLGLLVVDPWAGEERMALALYRGAGDLAREIGAREVIAAESRADYLGRSGYRRRGHDWRLDVASDSGVGGRHRPPGLFGMLAMPFYRALRR